MTAGLLAFTPGALANHFGAESAAAGTAIRGFCGAIERARDAKTRAIFRRWRALSGAVSRAPLDGSSAPLRRLSAHYGVPEAEPTELLFAIHTYYALLLKLLAALAASPASPPGASIVAKCAAAQAPAELLVEISSIERGDALARAGITGFLDGDIFNWYLPSWDPGAALAVSTIARALDAFDPATLGAGACPQESGDLVKRMYQALLPGPIRRDLGEYYTPDWLAEHVVRELGYDGDPGSRLLDPACGSGTFLVLAIRRIRARFAGGRSLDPEEHGLLQTILRNVIGFDLNPLAVLAAKTNYLLAVRDLLGTASGARLPVYLVDSILGRPAGALRRAGTLHRAGTLRCAGTLRTAGKQKTPRASLPAIAGELDYVVGNPPWINWSSLSAAYRRRVAPLFNKYGLFPHKGLRARTGAAMDDLSVLLTYVSLDRYLKRGGLLGFVITQSVFKSEGGGEGFRRFALSDREPIQVIKVSDLSALQPFEGVTSRTATVVLKKGAPTVYPVPYALWRPRGPIHEDRACDDVMARVDVLPRLASPISPAKPASPWIAAAAEALAGARRCLGASDYKARYGTHCHASGVYWVESLAEPEDGKRLIRNMGGAGKKKFPTVERRVDNLFIHRLARGRDVDRWSVTPMCSILLPQSAADLSRPMPEADLSRSYGDTYEYLRLFEPELRARSGYKKFFKPGVDPFYSVYNIGAYTFAKYKVVWREVASDLRCAVIDGDREPAVPDHTLVSVAAETLDEAHYLCAALSSSPANFVVRGYVTLHPGPHVLKYIRIPRYDPTIADHRLLALLSARCHEAARARQLAEVAEGERAIDAAAARLWGIEEGELAALREALP